MKKLGLLSFVPLVLLCSCGNSDSSDALCRDYLDKEYVCTGGFLYTGYVFRFYEDKVNFIYEHTRFPCFYEKDKLDKDLTKKDEINDISIKGGNEYVFVYAQGINSNYPSRYDLLGLFSNQNTFITVEYPNFSPELSISGVFVAK